MNLEKYPLKSESSFTLFEFNSEGANGVIRKLIQFQEIGEEGLYNLAFGDYREGAVFLDDTVISNNGDSEKVLVTVVASVYSFLRNTLRRSFMLRAVRRREPDYTEWEYQNIIQ